MGNETSAPVTYGQRLLNSISVEWKKVETAHQFPARDGHCAAPIDKKLFVFGGVCWNSASDDVSETNDTLIFDSENLSWSKAATSGKIPSPRSSATMAAVGRKLYVFGGVSNSSGWLNDLHCLDTETMTWTKVTGDGNPPTQRDKLCSVTMGAKILFFGGFGPLSSPCESVQSAQAEFTWFNDVHSFDTEKNVWESLNPCLTGCPSPRAAHGMCLVDSKLVIFGGRDSVSRRSDLFLLDLESMEWVQGKTAGRQPEPRSFHSLTAVDKRAVVFGGRGVDDNHFNELHIYDSDTAEWMQPKVTGAVPASRGVHTCSVVGDYLVLFGGSAKFDPESRQCEEYFSDTHYIHTGQLTAGESQGVDPEDNTQGPSVVSDSLGPLEEEESSEDEDISDDGQR